ncbi:uncharacterized protein RAG0_07678 [Rhynchosporium agropyri]|uniref:Uncharacterized protein n=1 Tax=Rhynchosporium agropyri TaxID=914238 RepID=A0A1E1KMR5_9HELO|nr:uncharacterized protein RAG0_07678 [Rhynchosporium agropyri]
MKFGSPSPLDAVVTCNENLLAVWDQDAPAICEITISGGISMTDHLPYSIQGDLEQAGIFRFRLKVWGFWMLVVTTELDSEKRTNFI